MKYTTHKFFITYKRSFTGNPPYNNLITAFCLNCSPNLSIRPSFPHKIKCLALFLDHLETSPPKVPTKKFPWNLSNTGKRTFTHCMEGSPAEMHILSAASSFNINASLW